MHQETYSSHGNRLEQIQRLLNEIAEDTQVVGASVLVTWEDGKQVRLCGAGSVSLDRPL